jgi:hypothetical protein
MSPQSECLSSGIQTTNAGEDVWIEEPLHAVGVNVN